MYLENKFRKYANWIWHKLYLNFVKIMIIQAFNILKTNFKLI